jgi:hypothetical protein
LTNEPGLHSRLTLSNVLDSDRYFLPLYPDDASCNRAARIDLRPPASCRRHLQTDSHCLQNAHTQNTRPEHCKLRFLAYLTKLPTHLFCIITSHTKPPSLTSTTTSESGVLLLFLTILALLVSPLVFTVASLGSQRSHFFINLSFRGCSLSLRSFPHSTTLSWPPKGRASRKEPAKIHRPKGRSECPAKQECRSTSTAGRKAVP